MSNAEPNATGNAWLSSLAKKDLALLKPHLTDVACERGLILIGPDAGVDQVYFPTEGVVSLITDTPSGDKVETAVIGCEGLVGMTCGPLNGLAHTHAVAQTPVKAIRMNAAPFSEAVARSDGLRAALGRYTEALLVQAQQGAACNALHRLEARLARWLLEVHDRVDSDSVALTQAELAEMLGVRRATVSEVGAVLEEKGLIRRGRGKIQLLDRPGLEAAACECYGALKVTLADLLPSGRQANSL